MDLDPSFDENSHSFGLRSDFCQICQSSVETPVQLICGHSFCAACVLRGCQMDVDARCPTCLGSCLRHTVQSVGDDSSENRNSSAFDQMRQNSGYWNTWINLETESEDDWRTNGLQTSLEGLGIRRRSSIYAEDRTHATLEEEDDPELNSMNIDFSSSSSEKLASTNEDYDSSCQHKHCTICYESLGDCETLHPTCHACLATWFKTCLVELRSPSCPGCRNGLGNSESDINATLRSDRASWGDMVSEGDSGNSQDSSSEVSEVVWVDEDIREMTESFESNVFGISETGRYQRDSWDSEGGDREGDEEERRHGDHENSEISVRRGSRGSDSSGYVTSEYDDVIRDICGRVLM